MSCHQDEATNGPGSYFSPSLENESIGTFPVTKTPGHNKQAECDVSIFHFYYSAKLFFNHIHLFICVFHCELPNMKHFCLLSDPSGEVPLAYKRWEINVLNQYPQIPFPILFDVIYLFPYLIISASPH